MNMKKINKIVLLDDDEIANAIAEQILMDFDQVDTFKTYSDPYQAFQYLEDCKESKDFPELIIVDLKMPEMDGFEFIENYENKFYEIFPDTKIMMLTSSIRESERTKSLQYKSVADFVNKPINPEKLSEIINQMQGV